MCYINRCYLPYNPPLQSYMGNYNFNHIYFLPPSQNLYVWQPYKFSWWNYNFGNMWTTNITYFW